MMPNRTELLDAAPDVTPLIRPSRISQQLAVQGRISLSEVLSALSCALDLTEGAPAGHTMRTCLIGMRIAESIGIDTEQRSALYYALLLKDAGCSSNAGRMAALFEPPAIPHTVIRNDEDGVSSLLSQVRVILKDL